MNPEILKVFKEFREKGYLDGRLNVTFITLIPKMEGEKEICDYRPICLLSGIYKMIGKTLANRLKVVLGDLLSDFHCGGLPERQLHEGVLVANELIDTRLKRNIAGLVWKIDFMKAFDTVSWSFMDRLFEKYGFNVKWRRWLSTCSSTARFSILINGKSEDFFKSTRGLRQGDPCPRCSLH